MPAIILHLLPELGLITLGSLLAWRWVFRPTAKPQKYSGWFRHISLLIVCWAGSLIVANLGTLICRLTFDPADFPGDKGLTAEMAYTGDHNLLFVILFGWVFYPISLSIAGLFKFMSSFRKGC